MVYYGRLNYFLKNNAKKPQVKFWTPQRYKQDLRLAFVQVLKLLTALSGVEFCVVCSDKAWSNFGLEVGFGDRVTGFDFLRSVPKYDFKFRVRLGFWTPSGFNPATMIFGNPYDMQRLKFFDI